MNKHLRRKIELAEREVAAAQRRLKNLREKGETHPIADAEERTSSMEEALDGRLPCLLEGYDVADWCPTPDGSGPATQVHLRFDVRLISPNGPRVAALMRFKHPGELDRFIAVLTRHRLGVWPMETT